MAQSIADAKDVQFVLHEQLGVAQLGEHELFAEFNRKTVDLIIKEARNLAIKEILPTHAIGDREGVLLENGKVAVPEAFHRPWELLVEGEWVGMSEDPEYGGQGIPYAVACAANEYLVGANMGFMMYATLTHGAGLLVDTYGTKEQKRLFLKKMFSGKWTGTMLLTEPEAGSDVGALTTAAVPNDDGTYAIKGAKIFISAGEHNLAENIIHPVLARIEGAPEGTDGVSLFLVPKFWVNDDGSLGEFNDVVCTGVEDKLGLHSNATCSLILGENGKCRGLLLGDKHKGVRAMFKMMNAARLAVGLQGLALAGNSYLNALDYARKRLQGRSLIDFKDKSAPSVPIIQHPDVKRMLLSMKAFTEGARSLIYYISFLEDQIKIAADETEKRRLQGMIDFLIPISKGYVTDRAFEACSTGVQIFGGYGYIQEYPQERLLRDCRITQIYEGTNGIQAMDLLGRKLGQDKGAPIKNIGAEIMKIMELAKQEEQTEPLCDLMGKALYMLNKTARYMGKNAASLRVMFAFAHATPFMEVVGDVTMAWMLLWRAVIAAQKINAGAPKKEQAFLDGQLKSAEYFITSVLPGTLGKMHGLLALNGAAVEIQDASFGGK